MASLPLPIESPQVVSAAVSVRWDISRGDTFRRNAHGRLRMLPSRRVVHVHGRALQSSSPASRVIIFREGTSEPWAVIPCEAETNAAACGAEGAHCTLVTFETQGFRLPRLRTRRPDR